MHIHFVGIGGAGIGPLALVAYKAGYTVSGSDIQNSSYIDHLMKQGIKEIHIGPSEQIINDLHKQSPIDWVVYSSALVIVEPNPPFINFCKDNGIKCTKRADFINQLLKGSNQKMIAVAGTHGKTTTTAMLVWLFKHFKMPLSYILPAKVSYGDMGDFDSASQFFIYEADEFDRNFLSFAPGLSIITGVSWDHHEIYPTLEEYKQAFNEFIDKSEQVIIWRSDAAYLAVNNSKLIIQNSDDPMVEQIKLKGLYNRRDAWLAITAAAKVLNKPASQLVDIINQFPGLSRRMEELVPNLYSDYAHTPEKIRAAMSAALEIAKDKNQSVVVIYEPLTNRRQVHMLKLYQDCFKGAKQVYWLPSYLARETPGERIIEPQELISNLSDPAIANASSLGPELKTAIAKHLAEGDMVVGMAGGGNNSLDDWLRDQFSTS